MKHKLAIVVLSAGACMALQARAQIQAPYENTESYIKPDDSGRLPAEPEAVAEDLQQQGKCARAVRIFRALAVQGAGFEISQFNLGRCLLDMSKTEPDAQRAAGLKHEAVEWITEAANNGLPNAQIGLVTIYLDGDGVASDPVEAGKWSLIYHANSRRFAIGLPDISSDLQERLDGALTEKTWAEAQSRAIAWSPTAQNMDTGK